jgi:hypothetical protein
MREPEQYSCEPKVGQGHSHQIGLADIVSLWRGSFPVSYTTIMRLSSTLALGSALTILFPLSAYSFYLPGTAPHNYIHGEEVNLFVNALTPMLAGTDDAKLVRDLRKETDVMALTNPYVARNL